MSLAAALERAADALHDDADVIRPANGDPRRLLEELSAEAAARVLGWLLREAPDEADELLEDWEEDDAGVAVVLALSEDGLSKAGRKVLRRTRHRLRSRGVAGAEPAPRPVVAALPAIEDDFAAGLVTGPDPTGLQLAYLVEADPSGGGRLFELTLDADRGVVDLRVYGSSRSRIRGFLREVAGRSGLSAVEAPPDSIRALVARVAERQATDRPEPGELSEWRSHVAGAPADAVPPGALVASALSGDPSPASLRQVVERVQNGEVGPWPAPASVLEPVVERIRSRAESKLLVDATQRRQQADEALGESLGEVFTEAGAAATADRFRAAAYVHWRRDDEATAELYLSAAAAFEKLPVEDNPIARALLEATLAPLFASLEQDREPEEEAAPSLVAKP